MVADNGDWDSREHYLRDRNGRLLEIRNGAGDALKQIGTRRRAVRAAAGRLSRNSTRCWNEPSRRGNAARNLRPSIRPNGIEHGVPGIPT